MNDFVDIMKFLDRKGIYLNNYNERPVPVYFIETEAKPEGFFFEFLPEVQRNDEQKAFAILNAYNNAFVPIDKIGPVCSKIIYALDLPMKHSESMFEITHIINCLSERKLYEIIAICKLNVESAPHISMMQRMSNHDLYVIVHYHPLQNRAVTQAFNSQLLYIQGEFDLNSNRAMILNGMAHEPFAAAYIHYDNNYVIYYPQEGTIYTCLDEGKKILFECLDISSAVWARAADEATSIAFDENSEFTEDLFLLFPNLSYILLNEDILEWDMLQKVLDACNKKVYSIKSSEIEIVSKNWEPL